MKKQCLFCGDDFFKGPDIPLQAFRNRRYCGKGCKMLAEQERRRSPKTDPVAPELPARYPDVWANYIHESAVVFNPHRQPRLWR